MGSIVISDVVSDLARLPHTMVVGDVRRGTSATPERHQVPPGHSQSSYPHNRSHSPSATPTQTTISRSSTSSTHLASQYTPPGSSGGSAQRVADEAEAGGLRPIHYQDGETDGFDRSGFPLSNAPRGLTTSPPSPRLLPTLRSSLSLNESACGSPNRIKVRDLNHIQSFASEEVLTRSHRGSRHSLRGRQDGGQQYEISAMPVTDIIEMVSGLLTKITTTNDRQHEHIHRHIPPPEGATGLSQQTNSVLAFHGKNVPSITILSYLSRIHKYCPTTYEVFLSLLVYFDRMTEMINNGTLSSFRYSDEPSDEASRPSSSAGQPHSGVSNVCTLREIFAKYDRTLIPNPPIT